MPLTYEALIIGIARVAGSLPVLRWPLAGALIAIAVDFSDLFMWNLLPNSIFGGLGGREGYQSFDKVADLAYQGAFLWVALHWGGVAARVAAGLFAFRMIGFLAFEIVSSRWILLAFPSVFDFWFVFVAARNHYRPEYELTMRRVAGWLVVLTALKLGHEWALHGGQYLDRYRAVDVVADWWEWVSGPF